MFNNQGGVDLVSGFPCVVTFRVSLPFGEVLKLL